MFCKLKTSLWYISPAEKNAKNCLIKILLWLLLNWKSIPDWCCLCQISYLLMKDNKLSFLYKKLFGMRQFLLNPATLKSFQLLSTIMFPLNPARFSMVLQLFSRQRQTLQSEIDFILDNIKLARPCCFLLNTLNIF